MGRFVRDLLRILFPKETECFEDRDKALEVVLRQKGKEVPEDTLQKIEEYLNCVRENSIVARIEYQERDETGLHTTFVKRYYVHYNNIR